jgi:hypothetical protein
MGADGCSAPDWWSGYPGEAPIRDKQVSTAASFAGIVNSSQAAKAAMNGWGEREVPSWKPDDAEQFYNKFLKAGRGVLPVYEPQYSVTGFKETHTLYWNSLEGKQRWLASMWDGDVTRQAQKIAAAWRRITPKMATLSLHLNASSSTSSDPQKIFVAPEREFKDHIIEVKP